MYQNTIHNIVTIFYILSLVVYSDGTVVSPLISAAGDLAAKEISKSQSVIIVKDLLSVAVSEASF